MALCGSRSCGCALQSTSLQVSGSGAAGDPWVIEGASPSIMTDAQRLALTGADLFEGRHVWTTDTNREYVYNGVGWNCIYQRKTTYTPTSSTITLGNAAIACYYTRSGPDVTYKGRVILGTTTSFPGGGFTPSFSLPVAAEHSSTQRVTGDAWFYDGSATQLYHAKLDFNAAGDQLLFYNAQGATNNYQVSTSVPFAWASAGQDEFVWSITYPSLA